MTDTDVTTSDDRADESALRRLAIGYAIGVDQRDREGLLALFHPDARLEIRRGSAAGEVVSELRGHGQLGLIPDAMAQYRSTFHLVGNTSYRITGTTAEGEVYCIAHHLVDGPDGTSDLALYLRYLDHYRRDAAGGWLIESRQGIVQWSERRPAQP
ncbi:nuclear transport factor 2 family protein [Nocardia sp. alder85J]|uniref:nuclear transport factor 2 family protein n=1 Tax=Nocardia sp. alder85J TaxID=2862949 RepID=UPI001CD608DF|nr:nuclear transport factor 2 family protein [Nocardia sp. alder85J]MCX4094667.1 nuclear transport factor 2 family protein [Nocardia sp. alder85J]